MKIKPVQISRSDGYITIIDDRGRVWTRQSMGDWLEITLPDEPENKEEPLKTNHASEFLLTGIPYIPTCQYCGKEMSWRHSGMHNCVVIKVNNQRL